MDRNCQTASRFDGRTFSGITTSNGLCSNVIHSLTLDRQGGLWIGSPTGAMCLPPDTWSPFLPESLLRILPWQPSRTLRGTVRLRRHP
ncbi:MAG: hypothetical protein IPI01_08150 [Ignavibacteriae bacterium]|nr:hypothetical protein [Ignavibacteriota bacterium]